MEGQYLSFYDAIMHKSYGEAVNDCLPTAEILEEKDGVYTVSAEVFGKGIDMWLRSQGERVEVMQKRSKFTGIYFLQQCREFNVHI